MEAYCMKCRKKVQMVDEVKSTTKRGTNMTKGKCSTCGTNICRLGN